MYRTAVGQPLRVSQLRADIAFAVKEQLSRSLQQPDNEDLKNLKQLLRYIKGTTHYKLTLAPKATYNERNEIQVDIESFTDSDWAGCNSTRKSTSGTITSCWGTPLLHISRTINKIPTTDNPADVLTRHLPAKQQPSIHILNNHTYIYSWFTTWSSHDDEIDNTMSQ
eukprot:4115588-Amphidinium_carterae.2